LITGSRMEPFSEQICTVNFSSTSRVIAAAARSARKWAVE
jgi:hypothetical protein